MFLGYCRNPCFRGPQCSMKPNRHSRCDNSRNDVCNRLCAENAIQSPKRRKDQKDRDKADSLAAGAEDAALCGLPHHKEQK